MVVVSKTNILDNISQMKTCKPTCDSNIFTEVPVIDLADHSNAGKHIVHACKEFGFFKVINHGVSVELTSMLEAEAVKFFGLPQQEKDKSGPANPFGYGNKTIGCKGDMGWIEYLLFCTNPELTSQNPEGISATLRVLVDEYVSALRNMACDILEMIAMELKIGSKDALSRLIRHQRSDSCFRLNHYPAFSDKIQPLMSGNNSNLIGIGEHTDPQIISVGRSNNASGLQICLRDGNWVSIPPDHTSFYINVGDSLQVMTNGRFRSVKHRVLANGATSRVSMIFFGGPPLSKKITPLPSLMEESEESLYEEFTWSEYKNSAYKTRLGDHRLGPFEKDKQQPA